MTIKTDLHTHTYFSDGFNSPEKLIEKANNRDIKILSHN